MSKCLKCNIEISTLDDKCPLCNTKIDKSEITYYPIIKKSISNSLIRKVILLIIIVASITTGSINYFFTPQIKWSLFVIIQLFSVYYVLNKLLKGGDKILSTIFEFSLLVNGISIFWDYYTGFNGWSIDYVLPSISITYLIFIFIYRVINYISFHTSSNYVYLNILLCFLPSILLILKKVNHPVLTIISGILTIINLIVLIVFDWHNFKSDIEKNLYI